VATEHTADDDLELYALARLPESSAVGLEEHLLVCAQCRDRLVVWDEYVAAMREASRQITHRAGCGA